MVAALLLAGCGDDGEPPCESGTWTCSEDGYVLSQCVDGKWQDTSCMADQGQLCQDGACVDPWRYDDPTWDKCADDPLATPESLHDKMVHYESLARRVHVRPPLKWMLGVTLVDGADEDTATFEDVEQWHTGENDGLWSSLYITAEAYRYAVTRDSEALTMLETLLEGEQDRMRITGVPGLFTRQLIPPDVPGIACPTDPARYVPDEEKDDNMWVRIGSDGCIQTANPTTGELESTTACGLDDYAGWCWLDNVSQDEYSGHVLALAAVTQLVDDPTVRRMAADLLSQVAHHLIDNDLMLIDWDGRRTEHGSLWPPFILGGYHAAMILGFFTAALQATDDAEIEDFYQTCLLQTGVEESCWPDDYAQAQEPFPELLGNIILYFGVGSCASNWNNFSMYMLYLHTLLLAERDPTIREAAQGALRDMFEPEDEERPLIEQHNALFDFQFGALKLLGPASDGPAADVVRDGICQLRQFPASEHIPTLECPASTCVLDTCVDRFEEPMSVNARQTAQRCPATFLWWGNPYRVDGCTENVRRLHPPADFLLPYWMGRYYGFIDATD